LEAGQVCPSEVTAAPSASPVPHQSARLFRRSGVSPCRFCASPAAGDLQKPQRQPARLLTEACKGGYPSAGTAL
jgi:hypothetical protein